jgi:phytoene dehydrogenase-like protein
MGNLHTGTATVIGSGPNGLAAAIVLAEAGVAVRVIEAQTSVGGGVRSAELTLPGFKHDRCSAIYPLAVSSPFFRLRTFERQGLSWIHPPTALAHPFDDGTAGLIKGSLEETAKSFGPDAAPYRALFTPLVRHWPKLSEEFLQPLLHFPGHPLLMAKFGLRAIRSAASLAAGFQTPYRRIGRAFIPPADCGCIRSVRSCPRCGRTCRRVAPATRRSPTHHGCTCGASHLTSCHSRDQSHRRGCPHVS